jgi:hypothetical protein
MKKLLLELLKSLKYAIWHSHGSASLRRCQMDTLSRSRRLVIEYIVTCMSAFVGGCGMSVLCLPFIVI